METTRRPRHKPTSTDKRVVPTKNDAVLFRVIQEHPTIDTTHIQRLTGFSKDWTWDRLNHFANETNNPIGAPYLIRCPDQFKHGNKAYRALMYEAEPEACDYADQQLGALIPHPRANHSFEHLALEMRIVAGIRIACKESPDHEFITPEEALELAPPATRAKKYPFVIDVNGHNVSMDWRGPFGIAHQGKAAFFAIEADNMTERIRTKNTSVQSLVRKFRQWDAFYKQNKHIDELGLRSFMVPFFFLSELRMKRSMKALEELVRDEGVSPKPFLFKSAENFVDYFNSPKPAPEMMFEPFLRVGHSPYSMAELK